MKSFNEHFKEWWVTDSYVFKSILETIFSFGSVPNIISVNDILFIMWKIVGDDIEKKKKEKTKYIYHSLQYHDK